MTYRSADLLHPKYRPDIDGLRAVAVLVVVGYHAFPGWVHGGFIGVDVFFVISGFLISTILFENLERGTFSFAGFYARRIRRIFPALIVVLAACYAFGWFALLGDEYRQLGKHIAGGAGFISNFLFWNEAGYFDAAAVTKPLLHLWSLGIEEQFYIVWPLLLWAAWKLRFNPVYLLAALALASFYVNLQGTRHDAVAAFYSPQTRFWELMCGGLLAWRTLQRQDFFSRGRGAAPAKAASPTVSNLCSVLGLLLMAYGVASIGRNSHFPGAWALAPTLGATLMISAGPAAWLNRRVLANRVLVWFGLISYPLYLWHWPLLSYARIVASGEPPALLRLGAVVLAIAAAWLTYVLVERPVRFGKHGGAKALGLATLMLCMGLVGYGTWLQDGLGFRAAAREYQGNHGELLRTPAVDGDCLAYIHNPAPLFPYCRFSNAGGSETVAVIGDSHAHVAYSGIAALLAPAHINTLLLGNSSCPPFLDAPNGVNDTDKERCRQRIAALIATAAARLDVKKVFMFTRGPLYLTGRGTTDAEDAEGQAIGPDTFRAGLQRSIDALARAGKQVFYVTENPELNTDPEACVPRPFRSSVADCGLDREAVRRRQAAYLALLHQLSNVTVIDASTAFCRQQRCAVSENGELLYADDNHLSLSGSRFQAERLLKRYLD